MSWQLNHFTNHIHRFLKVFLATACKFWKDKLKQVRTVIYQVLKHNFWQSKFNPGPKSLKQCTLEHVSLVCIHVLQHWQIFSPEIKDGFKHGVLSLCIQVFKEIWPDWVFHNNGLVVTVVCHVLENRKQHECSVDIYLEHLRDVRNQAWPCAVCMDWEVCERCCQNI